MTKITAGDLHYRLLNQEIRLSKDKDIVIENCLGQRFIGSGCIGKNIEIHGVPGNALGAYLTQSNITVYGNAQDATGDTMNDGTITIHGNCGDAPGYGMRDGMILIQRNAGYRAGIHMKQYMEKVPVLVIGGKVGDFLAEYQAGGRIVVLGLGYEDICPVGSFCGTGMHGGAIYIRTDVVPHVPAQVMVTDATDADKEEIRADVDKYTAAFGGNTDDILSAHFFKLIPNTQNPYKQLYVNN